MSQTEFSQTLTNTRSHLFACLLAAVMLLAALGTLRSSDFYTVLRLVVCAVAAYLAVRAWKRLGVGLAIVPIAIAIVFNPIAPLSLTRDAWVGLDVLACLAMIVYAFIEMPAPDHATGVQLRRSTAVDATGSEVVSGGTVTNTEASFNPMAVASELELAQLQLFGPISSWRRAPGGYFVQTVEDPTPCFYDVHSIHAWTRGASLTRAAWRRDSTCTERLCADVVRAYFQSPHLFSDLAGYYDALASVGAIASHTRTSNGGVVVAGSSGAEMTFHGEGVRMFALGGLAMMTFLGRLESGYSGPGGS